MICTALFEVNVILLSSRRAIATKLDSSARKDTHKRYQKKDLQKRMVDVEDKINRLIKIYHFITPETNSMSAG